MTSLQAAAATAPCSESIRESSGRPLVPNNRRPPTQSTKLRPSLSSQQPPRRTGCSPIPVSVPQLGRGSSGTRLTVRCGSAGPAYFTGYGSRKPIVSSLDGRATLRLRSLTCGKADPVQDDATMSVVGSIAGEVGWAGTVIVPTQTSCLNDADIALHTSQPTFAVELDCPKGAAAKVNALGNLPAVDRM